MEIKFSKKYNIETTFDQSPMRKNTFEKESYERIDSRKQSLKESEKRDQLGLKSFARVQLTKDELYENITRQYKTLFKANSSFSAKENQVNILVGDNGCGKSTLIKLLLKANKDILAEKKVLMVDMEKANPNITKPKPEKGFDYSVAEVVNMWMIAAESHGETREGVLLSVLSHDFDILILDEPESGLSLRNQKKYAEMLKSLNKTVILITHSKVFIETFEEVFDVEKMKWKNSKKYLKSLGV